MVVTGFRLMEQIRMRNIELKSLRSQYDDSLFAFPDDNKLKPQEIINQISVLEVQLAMLQTAQCVYNVSVKFDFNGVPIHLANAIKLTGGLVRQSQMWEKASFGEKQDRYYSPSLSRNKEVETAKPTMDKKLALSEVKNTQKLISQLKSVIATMNSKEIEIDFVDEKLLA